MTSETSAVALETKQQPWWLTLITGVLALIVGAILLWGGLENKIQTYMILVAALGIYFLIKGVLDIVSIFVDHSMWGWKLFLGLIGIAAGVLVLSYPVMSAVALPKTFVLVLGIWGLMQGIVLLIMAFAGGGWGAGIMGALGIIFGIALIVNWSDPGMGLAMIWTMAIFGVIGGIVLIVRAFQQRAA